MEMNRRSLIKGGASTLFAAGLGTGIYAATPAYNETGTPQSAGRVSGQLKYAGNGEFVPSFPVIKDHDICGVDDREPKALRVSDDGELGDCVVEIKGVTAGKNWDPIFNHGKIYQIDCSFQPYVQIIRSSAYVDVHNFDPILHNIHAYEVFNGTRRSMFNFAQPEAGLVDRVDLNLRRGNLMMIDCNAHNWMAAWVYTSTSPYLSVTSVDGRFDIPDIPPGQYVLSIWHPLLGEKTANLSVAANADLKLDLVLT
ncbi:MAG: carboxypeptidase regulatory-like domain-containing protein [Yoonia sp.]|uniref:carboxypeptidase regulatory-like domain-containing protein n=2 Tax=Alphaproteobacteria TaxID=28211 RepID=UPI001FF619E6|nr:carboxypeptidase regulatory-like domain-containing protein [Loktanella sp. F6476L]MCK0122158.1 carboxypeptidase regulatory-like domain-containing protein [Loktanella sp. F6476L]UWR01143.1 hypothetical protein K3729_18135 [Rhodobacteraceae bacterium S2214]